MTRVAGLSVAAVAAAILIGTGVSPADLMLFGLFELGFVLLPGVVAYRALAREPGSLLQQVSVGAAAGNALLLGAFILTAATGARWAMWLLPALALAGAGLLIRSRGKLGFPDVGLSGRQGVALAGVAIVALALEAAAFFTQAPLPGTRPSVSYYPDLIWAIGLAGEALHHWPMTTPHVFGEPLRYHTFAFMEVAAVTQQTGIDPPVVSLRLFPASLLMLLVLQLSWAGQRFAGNPWAGPLAAGLVLLVGDLDLGAERPEPLAGLYFSSLYLSASQLLAMVFFLPTVGVIADLLTARGRPPPATLGLLAILLFGCAGAKASLLPVLLGGLVVTALWTRTVTPGWAGAAALSALALASSYVLMYSGGRGASELAPLESAFRSFPGRHIDDLAEGVTPALSYPAATWVTAVALLAPLAGLAFAGVRIRSPRPREAWLLGLFAASLAAFFLLDLPGVSQLYFLWFGYTAAALLGAGGLLRGLARWRAHPPRGGRLVVVGGLATGLVLAVGATRLAGVEIYFGVAAVLGAVAAASAFGLVGRATPARSAVLAVTALLTAGLLDAPLDRLPDIGSRALSADRAVHREADSTRERGLTPELATGLEWIRENTDESAVLAVNNHFTRPKLRESRYFYYSALGQRRVFIGSWDYTDKALRIGVEAVRAGRHPFPARLALNDSIYGGAGRSAAARLRRRGVTHVLVDRSNGGIPPRGVAGDVVYRNSALVVYRL